MSDVRPWRQEVRTGSPWEVEVGYCRAVRTGTRVDVAGTVAVADGAVVGPGDPYQQTQFILQTIAAALKACGGSLTDVTRTRLYVTDVSHWQAIGRAHGEAFSTVRPACTMVQVAALIAPEFLVEIEAEAQLHPAQRGPTTMG